MLDQFRPSDTALGVARLCGLVLGTALTLACATAGLVALSNFCSSGCTHSRKRMETLVRELRDAVTRYRADNGRCPATRNDLTKQKYFPAQAFVDSWGTSIAYFCSGDGTLARSAGPDKRFNTDDDITSASDSDAGRFRDGQRPRTADRVFDDALAKYTHDHRRCPTTKKELIAGGYLSTAAFARRPENGVAFVCWVNEHGEPEASYVPLIETDEDRWRLH